MPTALDVVVVGDRIQHFHVGFASIAREIVDVSTPGSGAMGRRDATATPRERGIYGRRRAV